MRFLNGRIIIHVYIVDSVKILASVQQKTNVYLGWALWKEIDWSLYAEEWSTSAETSQISITCTGSYENRFKKTLIQVKRYQYQNIDIETR